MRDGFGAVYNYQQSPRLEHLVHVIPDFCDLMIEGVTPTEAYILKMYKIAIYGI
jgi:hypothetical protein